MMLLGCSNSFNPPVLEGIKLPTKVNGSSDPSIVKLEDKLSKKGVKIINIGQRYLISVPSMLVFASDSPKINWPSYDLLNDLAAYLRKFRKTTVHVNTYSNCYLSERRTYALTLARSRAVANYLWSQNIESQIVFTQGMGNDKPIVAYAKCNDSSPNSRIEIVFTRVIV